MRSFIIKSLEIIAYVVAAIMILGYAIAGAVTLGQSGFIAGLFGFIIGGAIAAVFAIFLLGGIFLLMEIAENTKRTAALLEKRP